MTICHPPILYIGTFAHFAENVGTGASTFAGHKSGRRPETGAAVKQLQVRQRGKKNPPTFIYM